MTTKTRVTMEDLYATPGKAELVNGEFVLMSPTGDKPGWAGDEIFASLRFYVRMTNFGRAVGDNKNFLVNLPNRKSFSPDAAFYLGPPASMKFSPDVPVFAAGCKVVWEVDLLSADVVRVYRADAPDSPTLYKRGETAEAEPAAPGWKMPVDDLFE